MTPLRHALADYLQIRRALGYKLERAEKLLLQYLEYLEELGAQTVTIENAVGWRDVARGGRERSLVGVPALGRQRLRPIPERARRHTSGPARGSVA
jgi:hypothetical protein